MESLMKFFQDSNLQCKSSKQEYIGELSEISRGASQLGSF